VLSYSQPAVFSSYHYLQVISLLEYPALADLAPHVFPPDVLARAHELQQEIGSVGAYSHSQGVPYIRKNVARFIEGTLSVKLLSTFVLTQSIRT